MPLHPGPWVQPGDAWSSDHGLTADVGSFSSYLYEMFDASNETPPAEAHTGPVSPAHVIVDGFSDTLYQLAYQFAPGFTEGYVWRFREDFSTVNFAPAFAALPQVAPPTSVFHDPHVIGVEYEAVAGTELGPIRVVVSSTELLEIDDLGVTNSRAAVATDIFTGGLQVRRVPVADYDQFLPANDVAALDLVAEATFASSATTFSNGGTQNELLANVALDDVTADLTTADLDGSGGLRLVVVASRFVAWDHVSGLDIAPRSAGNGVGVAYKSLAANTDWGPFHGDIWFRPPRYRLLYDVGTPLRQFPRDDALGGAPRQGHDSRSVQGSARQGWVGTYR